MYLFGASGHGKVVLEIAEALGLEIDGFIDNDWTKDQLFGYPIFQEAVPNTGLIISLGNNNTRKIISERFSSFHFKSLVHPKSNVSKRADIADGTVVMAGVTINSSSTIGKHCIINTNAVVDHDCVINDFVHISPNAALAGNVTVGEGTQVGIGASVIQNIKIGKWCVIGAGAVVIKDVPDFAVVVGNPGRVIKSRKPEVLRAI